MYVARGMELFSCLGTQLAHSSSYHPQSDSQIEIVNTCLEGYIRCFGGKILRMEVSKLGKS